MIYDLELTPQFIKKAYLWDDRRPGGFKVRFHVVASSFPVSNEQTIYAGQLLSLQKDGYVQLATQDDKFILGVAGETNKEFSIGKPWELASETKGSGRMTVFNNGGEFWICTRLIDTWRPTFTLETGSCLYCSKHPGYYSPTASCSGDVPVDRILTPPAQGFDEKMSILSEFTSKYKYYEFVLINLLV